MTKELTSKASRDNELIYDVGMHRGEDTAFYLKKGFRVVGFEADPDLVSECRYRFSDEINEGKLIIVAGAIVDDASQAKIEFYKNLNVSVWGTVDPLWAARNVRLGAKSTVIEVETVDFIRCLFLYGVPYYMKVDIEGADRVCIEALEHVDVKPCYLSVESEKVVFEELTKELDLLFELGYTEFTAVQQANMHKTKMPIQSLEGKPTSYSFPKGSSGLFGRDLREKWVSKDEIVLRYRKIFSSYQRFGDATVWRRNKVAMKVLSLASKIVGHPIPGWYDTHARHKTCIKDRKT